MIAKPKMQSDESPAWVRWFVWGVLGGAGILALWAFMLTADRAQDVARFTAQGWPAQYADVIVGNKIRSLWHAAFMTLCAGGALWFFVRRGSAGVRSQESGVRSQRSAGSGQKLEAGRGTGRNKKEAGCEKNIAGPAGCDPALLNTEHRTLNTGSLVAWLLVLLVAGDAWLLSRHYVKTMPMSALDENPVISLLKKDMPEKRVALVSQDGFYNWWLTYSFPYHGINTVNITQMPRMPTDYKNFLSAVGRNPLRMWQLAAVGYVLAPAAAWPQIQRDPAWSNAFELVYSYSVAQADPERIEAGFNVYPATAQHTGQHVVLRLIKPAPRFALIGKYRVAEDDEALKLLGSPNWHPFEEVLIGQAGSGNREAGSGKREPFDSAQGRVGGGEEWGGLTNAGIVGTCKLEQYRSGRMELSVQAQQPAILRVSEKYDKDWKASIDGQPAAVRRIDYIFQGIFIPAGSHRVLLQYAPPIWGLYVQLVGLAICFGAVVWLIVGAVRRRIRFARGERGGSEN